MKGLVSYACFYRQYFNTVDSLYLHYPLSQTNFLVTCEFEIERIHYKYFHNTPFLSYRGRCSLILNSAGKSSALWPYSGWVFLRLLTDGWGGRGSKKPPLPKISHISYNNGTCHSYTLLKKGSNKSPDTSLELCWH